MHAKHSRTDPWSQTLGLLHSLSRTDRTRCDAIPASRHAQRRVTSTGCADGERDANIRVLDRPTSRTAIVTWGDATSCHYGDQVWRVARASSDGFCALSGQQIHRGDVVYRPSHYRLAPANAGSMMLAACVLIAPIEC
ncbi:DUF3331 domain-containing protein [Paraburkholderia rhizosphaerae]|uniref:Uncharacterized protein DUF3331 n=1 Tax=Paraburkholderia rhizosphaerae TaxID=480658 RepID=A0A4V3HE59_9BURK|nr:DUF3331 domain-containing protein [Paraburkholderia rhizosphaerae]TDY44503.1 uncharacterized protein DUF3331 [Paraburkholderia rhizosphaerae]